MSERWVFCTCNGCPSELPAASAQFGPHSARSCAAVENTCAVSIFDNDYVSVCVCVMCVCACACVGIRVAVGFYSIPTLVI